MNKKRLGISLITSLFLLNSINADEIKKLDTIEVTAQKIKQNIQDVPISMSVFDEFDIEDKRLESIIDIGKYTPNLMIFDIGFSTSTPPSIRGLFTDALTLESTMGIYVDGIPMTMGVGINDTLMDIERIEVLKGPQGTLYGKNTEAGVINIISKKPNNETRGNLSIKAGSDSLREYSGNISGAIIKDKLYLGLSGKYYEKDGFVKNTITNNYVDNREHSFGKIHLRTTPTDNLEFSLIKSILKFNDGASNIGSSFLPNRTVQSDLQGANNSKNDLTSFKIDYTINPNLKFESITTYRKFNDRTIEDYDFSNSPMMKYHSYTDGKYTKATQELRLTSTSENLEWLVGLSADKGTNKFNDFTDMYIPETKVQEINAKSIGVFAHSRYSFNDKFKILTGIRYDKETKSLSEPAKSIDIENRYNEVSPKLSFEYHNTPKIMSYFTVAKGYRAGGFNPYAKDTYPKTYDKETLWSYDLGFKSALLDDKLIFNANLYYMTIDDMQVTSNINYGDTYTSNAAKATSKGLEIDFKALLMADLTLFGGLGINETKFDEFKDAIANYSGNYSKFAPKYSFNLGITYRNTNGVYAQVDTNGYGKMYQDKENLTPRNAYELVNVKLGYETKNYDIYLYADNIFDKEYDSLKFAGVFDTFSKPKEIGVKLNYRF